MFVVSLIAPPSEPKLDPALVESLRNAWGGGGAQWLAPDEAAEFSIPVRPDNLWQVWRDLQEIKVDLAVQKAAPRRRRLLIADMDSTMIQQECIDELADVAGVGAYVADITARAMNGELDFEAALRERVALLKGLETSVIDTVLADRISLAPGAQTLVSTMKAHGAHTVLVSGGFTEFAGRVAEWLGFDDVRANRLMVDRGRLTGAVADPILGREAKVQTLQEMASALGLAEEDVLAVGDGANDLGMLQMAGAGVALHAKPAVAAECELRINHGDLSALLYLQGYSRDEFAV